MIERLTHEHILNAWELGANRSSIDRALVLLWVGMPAQMSNHADLPLGLRDQHLLELRRKTLGDVLECKTKCPHCDEILELSLSVSALSENLIVPKTENIKIGAEEFRLSALTSRDLADAASALNLEDATDLLRKKTCGRHVADIPDEIRAALEKQIEERESGSELLLSLTCINCAHKWSEALDIGNFFWMELEAKARKLLSEIAEIARSFGWCEQDILNLSVHRRQTYLSMIRGG